MSNITRHLESEQWHSYCAEVHERINNISNNIAKDRNIGGFQKSRDSIEVVRPYIRQRQHPITILFEIIEGLRADISMTTDPVQKALLFRNMWMFELETSNPVRVTNLTLMRFIEGKEGHKEDPVNLYLKKDGSWHLKYEIKELKNGAYRGRYDLPLNPAIWKDTEEYMFRHRPLLLGPESSWVLRPDPAHILSQVAAEDKEKALLAPMTSKRISEIFSELSQAYLPDCAGFGPHCCRHLVATEWLKNHPGAYAVAAAVLHDSERIVKDAYDWCEPKDKAAFWDSYLGSLFQVAAVS
jgi:hypothetical protein